MPTALEGARQSTPPAELVSPEHGSQALLAIITAALDEAKLFPVIEAAWADMRHLFLGRTPSAKHRRASKGFDARWEA